VTSTNQGSATAAISVPVVETTSATANAASGNLAGSTTARSLLQRDELGSGTMAGHQSFGPVP
jgi:hypothetical protein